ncbi:MAG: HEPN domain-containing protein [Thermoleophilaceae bacterium]
MPFSPYDAAADALKRADELLDASTRNGIPERVASDIRRSSLVLAVAAVDTYMHRLIVDRASMWDKLPKKLAETGVRFDQLIAEAQESYEAARRTPFNSRPGVRVKQILRNQLLQRTFQSLRQIEEALTMAGAAGNWKPISEQLGMTRAQVDARLGLIVMRRNQIVHEGDYARLDRPRDARRNELSESDARASVQFLRDLAGAIHAVV